MVKSRSLVFVMRTPDIFAGAQMILQVLNVNTVSLHFICITTCIKICNQKCTAWNAFHDVQMCIHNIFNTHVSSIIHIHVHVHTRVGAVLMNS